SGRRSRYTRTGVPGVHLLLTGERAMALAAIISWYTVIGVLAAIGTVTITRSRLSPRTEQAFFALVLIPVAAIYLAFVGYFGDASAIRPEAYAVAAFVVL